MLKEKKWSQKQEACGRAVECWGLDTANTSRCKTLNY